MAATSRRLIIAATNTMLPVDPILSLAVFYVSTVARTSGELRARHEAEMIIIITIIWVKNDDYMIKTGQKWLRNLVNDWPALFSPVAMKYDSNAAIKYTRTPLIREAAAAAAADKP